MNIQDDVIGLVLRENCKSKQMTDIIAIPRRCHGRIFVVLYPDIVIEVFHFSRRSIKLCPSSKRG